MALESSLSNIVIKNNTIGQGSFSTGAAPVSYNYNYHAWIFGSSIIEGNNFFAPAASSDMLSLDNCSCIIRGNKFVRGSTSINSYIRNYGSNQQIIMHNIFDSPTIDGTTETLALGLTDNSQYEYNTNQTGYVAIRLSQTVFIPGVGYFGSGTVNVPTGSISANFSGYPSGYGNNSLMESLTLNITTASDNLGRAYDIGFEVDLQKHMPHGARLLNAVIGLAGDGSRAFVGTGADFNTSSTTFMGMTAKASRSLNYTVGSYVGTVTDPVNRWSDLAMDNATQVVATGIFIQNTTDVDNFILASKYITLDASAQNLRVTHDKTINMRIEYQIRMLSSTSGTRNVRIKNGPLLIKYRW